MSVESLGPAAAEDPALATAPGTPATAPEAPATTPEAVAEPISTSLQPPRKRGRPRKQDASSRMLAVVVPSAITPHNVKNQSSVHSLALENRMLVCIPVYLGEDAEVLFLCRQLC